MAAHEVARRSIPADDARVLLRAALLGLVSMLATARASADDGGIPRDAGASAAVDGGVRGFPSQAIVNSPLPIYVEVGPSFRGKKAVLAYKPFGMGEFREMPMSPIADGYGAVISCDYVTTTGPVAYYVRLFDNRGDEIGLVGIPRSPLIIEVRNEIEGEQPRLPGQPAPEPCREVISDPPCVFDGTCGKDEVHSDTWPWPPPQQHGRGCAGCRAAGAAPDGTFLGLVVAGLFVATWRPRARRCSPRSRARRAPRPHCTRST
jgi:hypothetical protein